MPFLFAGAQAKVVSIKDSKHHAECLGCPTSLHLKEIEWCWGIKTQSAQSVRKQRKARPQNHPERPSQPLAVHLAWGREMTSRQESKRYLCLTVAGSG